MALPQNHIDQWKHNRAFLETIKPEFSDWLVTVTFYTALHAVDTLLAHDKITPTNHDHRNAALLRTNRYKHICSFYMPLFSLCRTIRYLESPGTWVPFEEVEKNVIERYLYPIERSVQKLIQRGFDFPKVNLLSASAQPSPAITPPAAS
jgi:hypothetical protein